jgi:hypothetical protein
MWAFPKAKPQLFSQAPMALAAGVAGYSFGRRLPRWQQTLLAMQPLVPVSRRLLTSRVDAFELATRLDSFEPVCGWQQWRRWEETLRQREPRIREWVHMRSQWGKRRSSALGVGSAARPHVFVTVEPADASVLHPTGPTRTFQVPRVRERTIQGSWLLTSIDPVPPFHRTPKWRPRLLERVAEEASCLLAGQISRPTGTPSHWQPMHGDFVPWNLREAPDGVLWLLDWEDSGWAPPSSDLLRYAVAFFSIHERRPELVVQAVRASMPWLSATVVMEAASFWTLHPNLQRPARVSAASKRQREDSERLHAESASFTALARSG